MLMVYINTNIAATAYSLILVQNFNFQDILILGKGPTQGLGDTTLTAEAKYSVNFT